MTTSDAEMRTAEPSAKPLEKLIIEDPYYAWQRHEGVRVILDFAFDDLGTVELTPWPRKGGSGAIINIPYAHLPNDAHLIEIKPGAKSDPEHHMYEENVYVVSGRGATSVWLNERKKLTFEWHAGSVFAIPLNAWYQHFNASGSEPARYLAVTNTPPIMRLFGDEEFVFNTPFEFKRRFAGDADYFSSEGTLYSKNEWVSNFIPNAPDMPLYSRENRGAGGIHIGLRMAQNNLHCHISEFPVGTYKKAHRHGPGAHLLILSGEGYSMLWTEGSEFRKADWRKGGMVIVPSDACFHQHFNTGATRARYLAMTHGDQGAYSTNARETLTSEGGLGGSDVSLNEGGRQIEYEDEDRQLHQIFETDLKRSGAPCLMKAFVPWCTGELGPTDERDT